MTRKHDGEPLTRRSFEFEVRAEEGEEAVITGMPVVFGREAVIRTFSGEYREMIAPGALDKTNMADVCLFFNHETERIPMARSKNGKGTLAFEVTPEGLAIRAALDVKRNAEAAALYSAVERGDITGMSFMFRVREDHWEGLQTESPLRIIDDISIIHEVSAVTDPAYPQTSIDARSSEETDFSPLEEARARAEETARLKALELEKAKNTVRVRV